MTVLERIQDMIGTANSTDECKTLLFLPKQMEEVTPLVVKHLNNLHKNSGLTQLSYVSEHNEYPEALYQALWPEIRQATLDYLNKRWPKAWFKPMYFPQIDMVKHLYIASTPCTNCKINEISPYYVGLCEECDDTINQPTLRHGN